MRALALLLCVLPLAAQNVARTYREAHESRILNELASFLSLPNIAGDLPNLDKNAALLQRLMEQRGIHTRLLTLSGVAPAVYGELPQPGAARTILFYAHYDGQPANAAQWAAPGPFTPTLRTKPLEDDGTIVPLPHEGKLDPEWRLYGRSASDDKGAIVAMLTALDALSAAGIRRTANIKFLFEGEEEKGSTHLGAILKANHDALNADVWYICDGPVSQNRQQQIYFGARGDVTVDVKVYGPRRELHSGHYGNWAPNPAMMLARLLASMKDDDGNVLVKGFQDGIAPLSETEKQAIAEAPDVDGPLRRELWLGRTEGNGKKLNDLITLPALNIRGLASAATGAQGRNVIPFEATASIDVRLVKGIGYRQAALAIKRHIESQGYFITESEPDAATRMAHPKVARVQVSDGYDAVRTPMELPECQEAIRRIERARGPVVKMPTLGGSVPLFLIDEEFHTPMVGIPIANHDNNQHAANENLRLQNLWDGIETFAALMQ